MKSGLIIYSLSCWQRVHKNIFLDSPLERLSVATALVQSRKITGCPQSLSVQPSSRDLRIKHNSISINHGGPGQKTGLKKARFTSKRQNKKSASSNMVLNRRDGSFNRAEPDGEPEWMMRGLNVLMSSCPVD